MYKVNFLSHNWAIKKALNYFIIKRIHHLNGIVLDLGCGTRPFEGDILKIAEKYIGVDWGNSLHELNADIKADLNQPLPIKDNFADHIVTFEVIEHLAEPASLLKEAHRILKKGGTLNLSVPFQWWLHEAPWDYQRYTKYGLQYQIEKAGFFVESLEEVTGFWTMWILKLNYQLNRIPEKCGNLKNIVRIGFSPFWFFSQSAAILFDKLWKEPNETAGYFVVARKL